MRSIKLYKTELQELTAGSEAFVQSGDVLLPNREMVMSSIITYWVPNSNPLITRCVGDELSIESRSLDNTGTWECTQVPAPICLKKTLDS